MICFKKFKQLKFFKLTICYCAQYYLLFLEVKKKKKKQIYETTNSLIDVLLHNQDLVTETKVINCPFSDHSFIAAKSGTI